MLSDEFEEQNRKFCFFRYEFFKRSKLYKMVEDFYQEVFASNQGALFDDLIDCARKKSKDLARAVELDLEYSVYAGLDNEDCSCLSVRQGVVSPTQTINDPVRELIGDKKSFLVDKSMSPDEFKRQMEAATRFYNNILSDPPPLRLGLLNYMADSMKRRKTGMQLPFERWKDYLKVYDIWSSQERKNKAAISREMGWFSKDDRAHSTEEVTKCLNLAEMLIVSSEKGTFPN